LASFSTITEHELCARVDFLAKDEHSLELRVSEVREHDGSGTIDIEASVGSKKQIDIDNLDDSVALFELEVQLVLKESFPQLPFERQSIDSDGHRLASREDELLEKREATVVVSDLVQDRVDDEPTCAERFLTTYDASDPVYVFKKNVWRALVQQKKRKDASPKDMLEVAQKQFEELKWRMPRLHEHDKGLAKLITKLDFADEFMERDRILHHLAVVLRYSSRLRTPFDCFMSHKWGEGGATHVRVVQIADELEKVFGLRCWLDKEEAYKNLGKTIAKGIDGSQTFCVFLDEDILMSLLVTTQKRHFVARNTTTQKSANALMI